MTTTTRVRDLGELLATLPYQFGFHLARCLVSVTMRNGHVGPLQRLDLPDDPDAGLDHIDLSGSLRVLRDHGGPVLLVVYEDIAGQGRAAMRRFEDLCLEAQIEVNDLVVVRDGWWWTLPEGASGARRPMPRDVDVPACASFVAAGVAPLASRDTIADLFIPRIGDPAGVGRELQRRRRTGPQPWADAGSAWAAVLGERHDGRARPWPTDVVAAAVHAVDDPRWRDDLISWLAPELFPAAETDTDRTTPVVRALGRRSSRPPGRAATHGLLVETEDEEERLIWTEQNLVRLVASTPRGDQAPVLTVLAAFWWWRGRGAFAETAVRSALVERPDYRLAVLLHAVVARGLGCRPGRGAIDRR